MMTESTVWFQYVCQMCMSNVIFHCHTCSGDDDDADDVAVTIT